MKRQLNARLLLALTIPTVLVVVGGVLLWQSQLPRIAESVRRRAEAARQAGQLDEAAQYLQRYLTYRPTDAAALAEYGLLLEDLAPSEEARRQARPILEKALQEDPRRLDVRRALVNLLIESGDRATRSARDAQQRASAVEVYSVALAYLDPQTGIDDDLKTPADRAWAALSRGRALEGQGKFSEAAAAYEAAQEAAAGDPAAAVEAAATLARLRRERLNQTAEATTLLDALVERYPDRADAYLARARHREAAGLPGVGEDLQRALELAPQDADVILEAALEEGRRPRPDPARIRSLLRQGIQANPKDVRAYRLLAIFEASLQQPAAAEAVLLEARAATGSLDAAWDLANLYIDIGQIKKARELKTLLDPVLGLTLSTYLATRIDLASGDWRKAGKTLETLAPALASDRPEWAAFAARAYYDLGRYYERLAQRTQLTDTTPTDRLQAQATDSYERAARLDPIRPEYKIARARALRQIEGFGETLEAQLLRIDLMIEQIRARPRPADPRSEAAQALDRAWETVEATIDSLASLKPPPDPELIPVLRAQVDLYRDRPAEARRRLEAARQAHPDRLPIWLGLVRVAEREGRLAEAAELLDEAGRRLGDSPELFAARVRYWSGLQSAIARRALIAEAARLAEFPADRQEELTLLLARALERARDDQAALKLWSDLADRQPSLPGIQLGLFDVAFRVGDDAAMARCVERLKQAEGEDGTLWRYVEAGRRIAAARGGPALSVAGPPPTLSSPPPDRAANLRAARELLDRVATRRSDWPRVPLMQAAIAEIEGKTDEAIAAYQRAVELGDRQVGVVARLVELLYQARRYADADAAIRRLGQEGSAADARLRRIQVENLIGLGDRDRALEAVKDAIPPDSTDYRDHVWLGRVYAALQEPARAEEELRRAIQLAPQAPETWLTLIQFLVRAGRPPAGIEAEIDRAAAALPAEQAALFLARAYEVVGRADRADELFRKALAARPDDPTTVRAAVDYFLSRDQFAVAEPLLRAAIDGPDSPPEQRAWARRTLALALSRPAQEARFQQALELIEANIQADPASPDEKRALAYILAARADRRREAIEAFERVGAALTPDDRLLLARLYEAVGDWPTARQRLFGLVADRGNDPQYVAAAIRSLLRHNELDEAEALIRRLEALEPGSLRVLALQGDLFKRQGRPLDPVFAAIQALVARVPAAAPSAAELLEQLGNLAGAEALHRDQIRRGVPGAAAELASFLGRHGRSREALELCDTARTTTPNLAIAAALGILASEPSVSVTDAQRVESWIDQAVGTAETDARIELECQRGILLALTGRRDEAVALHRRLLEDDPTAVQVLNNFAWILALTGGDPDEALELIDRAVRIAGPLPALLDTRAIVYLVRGEPARALEDLSAALGSDPRPTYYVHLARARLAAGDRVGALEALDTADERGLRAADIDPLERDAYSALVAELRRPS
jgi:tetratricopeptide (TPR) repeat protein